VDTTTYTEDDVQTWRQVVESMHFDAVDDHDLRAVDEGAADISSGAGLFNTLPEPIARLLLQAVEAGYGQALRDVRGGRVDGLGPLS
jgi:hypothetical protein